MNAKGYSKPWIFRIRRNLRKPIWIAWKKAKPRERDLVKRSLDLVQAWKSLVRGRARAGTQALRIAICVRQPILPEIGVIQLAWVGLAHLLCSKTAGCRTARQSTHWGRAAWEGVLVRLSLPNC